MNKLLILLFMLVAFDVSANHLNAQSSIPVSVILEGQTGQDVAVVIRNINYVAQGDDNNCDEYTLVKFSGDNGYLCVKDTVDSVFRKINLQKGS